jgi:hypothetical protein
MKAEKKNTSNGYFGFELNNGKNILVFGSNTKGNHGLGGALAAKLHWGAKQGCGEGRTGMAYGIPTKDDYLHVLSLEEIAAHVKKFIDYARQNPKLTFLVTRVGCGLSGYKDKDIGPLFAGSPSNCVLPDGWGK